MILEQTIVQNQTAYVPPPMCAQPIPISVLHQFSPQFPRSLYCQSTATEASREAPFESTLASTQKYVEQNRSRYQETRVFPTFLLDYLGIYDGDHGSFLNAQRIHRDLVDAVRMLQMSHDGASSSNFDESSGDEEDENINGNLDDASSMEARCLLVTGVVESNLSLAIAMAGHLATLRSKDKRDTYEDGDLFRILYGLELALEIINPLKSTPAPALGAPFVTLLGFKICLLGWRLVRLTMCEAAASAKRGQPSENTRRILTTARKKRPDKFDTDEKFVSGENAKQHAANATKGPGDATRRWQEEAKKRKERTSKSAVIQQEKAEEELLQWCIERWSVAKARFDSFIPDSVSTLRNLEEEQIQMDLQEDEDRVREMNEICCIIR
ncbi:hypothetical protein G7Y89_g1867 [Cudoniella acicularis]|uniref:Uncharacterized protein n=1 Tax=Cudoniella acicularis TaxID=354080 RepID=A0A8H4RVI4_9HELO|nr:hypothetical protein G7Y89_g1867 [Cudoniella acicularis]